MFALPLFKSPVGWGMQPRTGSRSAVLFADLSQRIRSEKCPCTGHKRAGGFPIVQDCPTLKESAQHVKRTAYRSRVCNF